MEKLTKAEEPVMQALWKLKKAFVKEIINCLADPKPPYNTISSLVRILEEKGLVNHETFGRTHRYFPMISKGDYRKGLMQTVIKEYFDGSLTSLVSQVVSEKELTEEEVEELQKLIKKS